ncbi:MAG: hypothetical protein PSX36_00820 [bacterium]|nr:hypothetical protein [bacterium]
MNKLFLLAALFCMTSFGHPFYLSVTDLKFNPKERALQGYVKIFTSDLENALRKTTGAPVDLIHPKDSLKLKQILLNYLEKHLSLTINKKKYSYELLGFEHEEEAIWSYVQVNNCPFPTEILVHNSILYDFIKDQSNIVQLEVNGAKKSSKVNCPEKELRFEFPSN